MNSYPSLFVDTPKITNYRQKVQRKLGEEDSYSSFVCRPLTIYATLLIVKRTSLSANSITFLMAILSVIAPIAAWQISDPVCFFAFSLFSFLGILFLDVLDGEVARLREQTSEVGEFVDSALWFTLAGLSIVCLLRVNEWYLHMEWLPPVILMLHLLKLYSGIGVRFVVPNTDVGSVIQQRSLIRLMLHGLLERPSWYLYFLVAAACGQYLNMNVRLPMLGLFLGAVGLDAFVVIKRLNNTFRTLSARDKQKSEA